MANLHPDLKKTLTDSGIPDDCPLLDYLDWAGIRTKNSLAMFFDETDKIDPWIHRFANKTTFGSPAKEIHYPEEDRRKGLLACFIAAWTECSDDLAQSRAAKLPTTSPAAPSIPPSTTPSTTDDKIPKTWPKGVYQQLLTDYKSELNTIPRTSPPWSRESPGPNVARAHHIQKLSSGRTWRNHHHSYIHSHRIREQQRQERPLR